ncbi:MAG: site-specific integrase [Acidimicrobiaceae bacterium]|nr:site-specific integrase [Acidimicrobiaceae bacterium]
MCTYLVSEGIECFTEVSDEHIPEWVEASGYDDRSKVPYDPAVTTMRNRRWAALVGLTEGALLGMPIDPRALVRGAIIIDDAGRKTRLLTDKQLGLVEVHADPGLLPSRRSVIVALSESGAKPSELPAVCLADIDLAAGTIALGRPGRVRINPLSEWAIGTIRRRIEHCPPGSSTESLCVRPATSPDGAARSVRTQLSQLMRQAGLGHIDGISGTSIRYTAARRVFEQRGIEACTRFLGVSSLDTAAAAVGHDWMTS